MKYILPLSAIVLLCACENKNESKTETTQKKDSVITEISQEKNTVKDLHTIQTGLESMTPLDENELKNKLPVESGGVTASDVQTSSATGAMSASAHYNLTDSSSVRIEIIDCGGPAGAGIFNTQYAGDMATGGADDESDFKVTQFRGHKAFESCLKERPMDCTFTFFDGKRLLVYVEGKNTGIEKLKQVAQLIQ